MSNWGRAFRNDYIEPERLPEHQRKIIDDCKISPVFGSKTWFEVSLNGNVIGYVRVTFCGYAECKVRMDDEPTYCGDVSKGLNRLDNKYSFGILRLIEITNEHS